jgi:hypothetical protein
VARGAAEIIPSYCRNTILRIPPAATQEADRALLESTARQFVAAITAGRDPIAAALGAATG